ncbi:MAG: cysteine--tRNA ligase [Candidatus Micrarchaeota archaeon]
MKIYNTMNAEKEELTTPDNELGIYICGPTVYDYAHLGHARSELVFDIIRRYLEYKGFKVKYIHNITDVDDKIIKKANDEGVSSEEVAKKYTEEYMGDMGALGIKEADVYPKATDNILEMVGLVKGLMEKGFAYQTTSGIYFEVSKFTDYGKLSKQDIEQLESGSRVCVDEGKRNPLDFALWKFAKPGEPSWNSPWGRGRPGWHIECSVMSMKYLKRLDIHGGGRDLIFPHHENEIAQSEAFTGSEMSRYWMHNGFINISGEKMSKSLGNIRTIKGILEKYGAGAVRLFILNGHYRGPINFDEDALKQAKASFGHLQHTVELAEEAVEGEFDPLTDKEMLDRIQKAKERFLTAMDDDFNTPFAMAEIHSISTAINSYINKGKVNKDALRKAIATYAELAGAVGLIFKKEEKKGPRDKLEDIISVAKKAGINPGGNAEQVLDALIQEREKARKGKDYAKADLIRGELQEVGIILEDRKEGTSWKLRD